MIKDFWVKHKRRGVSTPVVHHKDGNHFNNDPANLEPMHHGCHVRYHRSIEADCQQKRRGAPGLRRGTDGPYTEKFMLRMMPEQRAVLDKLSSALGVTRGEVLRAYLSADDWLEPLVMEARERNAGH